MKNVNELPLKNNNYANTETVDGLRIKCLPATSAQLETGSASLKFRNCDPQQLDILGKYLIFISFQETVGYNQVFFFSQNKRLVLCLLEQSMEKKNLFLKINLFLIGLTLLDAKTSCITVEKLFVSYVT